MTDYSAIILAGGKSSRMGEKKALLLMEGKPFIEIIIDKLIDAGVRDIMISGYEYNDERSKYVEDIFADKGPLSGIHAGLLRASGRHVIVLAEDAPLIPLDFIKLLMNEHKKSTVPITVASCSGRIQQLAGIYDKSLAGLCEEILNGKKPTVMALIERAGFCEVPYTGNEMEIKGFNTPEEYRRGRELCQKENI